MRLGKLALSTQNATTIDVLSQLFLRLASDWLVSGPSYYTENPLHAVCTTDLPAHFQSIRDASVHLDALCSEALRHWEDLFEEAIRLFSNSHGSMPEHLWAHECARECWAIAMARGTRVNEDPIFAEAINQTIAALNRWLAAFVPLVESNPASTSLMLLEIQFWQSWMSLL